VAGRDFHGGFVALHGDEALLDLDRVAGFDQQLDHGHFVEVANVGNLDVYVCHVQVPLQHEHAAEVAQDLAQVHVEAGRSGAVDHAVVPGQDSGNIRRGWKALPSHTGSMVLLHTPRMATSGALMMGVK
jgi:hypothetical protein